METVELSATDPSGWRGRVRLDRATFEEIETYLSRSRGILIPVGSTEQHGPIGVIGTDAICAEAIAEGAARRAGALVAPTLAYTPAPFNMSFAGTVSVSPQTFALLASEVFESLIHHGFDRLYVVNAHGANIEPLNQAIDLIGAGQVRLRSWWDFDPVNALRDRFYGDWEGMHATPSEIAIVQALHGVADHKPLDPPEKLTPDYIRAHSGDRHGPPDEHRAHFPDGRVGSHSSLARPEHGEQLLEAACIAIAKDYLAFLSA